MLVISICLRIYFINFKLRLYIKNINYEQIHVRLKTMKQSNIIYIKRVAHTNFYNILNSNDFS